MTIGNNLPPEMKDHVEKVTNKIKDFNEQMEKAQPEGYTNVMSVLKNVESKLTAYRDSINKKE